jgi:helicase
MQQPGERVSGSLLDLMVALRRAIRSGFTLNNESLENEVDLHTLVDGIDATLVDLMVEEIGEEELVRIATEISEQTFAVRQADQEIVALVNEVFVLRARRIANIANQGRLRWIKETGTRPRMLKSVESDLLTKRERWDDVTSPVDTGLVKNLLSWAWDLPDMKAAVRAFWEQEIDSNEFLPILQGWLSGSSQAEIARTNEIDIDTMLGIHSRIISYVLQVAVEQGLGLLSKILESSDQDVSSSIMAFPEHLRFGVPTKAALILLAGGIRHRRAAVALGNDPQLREIENDDRDGILNIARNLLEDRERWIPVLGRYVYEKTLTDVHSTL